ncbi:glycoside hydrolase family 19 protein [Erwinia sp. DT-104]|uniref:glycoside hydrolase family 19 protein n=1 Tax=Erwinia sp. DT-104 TaxID=3396161 RepID=UPI003F1BE4AD
MYGSGNVSFNRPRNYDKYDKTLHEDLVNNPDGVAVDLDIAVRTACEFWRMRHVNPYADKDDFRGVTYAVNGGNNGLLCRKQALDRIKRVMGI